MQPETRFKVKVLDKLRKAFPQGYFVKIQMVALMGIPDIFGCINGHFIAWELKRDEKEKPTRLQAGILSQIEKAGGHVAVVNPQNFEYELKRLYLQTCQ